MSDDSGAHIRFYSQFLAICHRCNILSTFPSPSAEGGENHPASPPAQGWLWAKSSPGAVRSPGALLLPSVPVPAGVSGSPRVTAKQLKQCHMQLYMTELHSWHKSLSIHFQYISLEAESEGVG